MKNLIKGFIDNGYEITFSKEDFYEININDGAFVFTFENWDEVEEVLLDYLVNEADL